MPSMWSLLELLTSDYWSLEGVHPDLSCVYIDLISTTLIILKHLIWATTITTNRFSVLLLWDVDFIQTFCTDKFFFLLLCHLLPLFFKVQIFIVVSHDRSQILSRCVLRWQIWFNLILFVKRVCQNLEDYDK